MSDAADLTEPRPDDSNAFTQLRSAFKHSQRELKDVRAEADELREAVDGMRGPALRGLAHAAGVKDPRHAAAVAKLHEGPVTAEAVAETVEQWGGSFLPARTSRHEDDS